MESSKKYDNRTVFVTIGVLLVMVVTLAIAVGYLATKSTSSEETEYKRAVEITEAPYGTTQDGEEIKIYTLKNKMMEVRIINYGGFITHILTPDKNGNMNDVTLGFNSLEDYETKNDGVYLGGFIGRYANRIAKGKFSIDGINYTLDINNPPNALHGGVHGFFTKVWKAEVKDDALILTYTSADGEENYPGELKVTVTYRLTSSNTIVVEYRAVTNKPTIINLTNHAYFNLAGHDSGNISDHVIIIDADNYTPVDDTLIPTGIIGDVSGTLYDLRNETLLGPNLPNVPGGVAYDINYVFGKNGWDKHMARLIHPGSGRTLDVYSTQPGMQLYTGFYLNDVPGKGGVVYRKYAGLCLETQHYPDSPNQPSFPSAVLRPGEVYSHTSKYVFGLV